MPTTMPYDSAKKKFIQDHINHQTDDANGKKHKLRYDKIEVQGEVRLEPIYRFKHDELAFNKANGRIHAEVIEKEAEIARTLDVWEKSDYRIIKNLLLSIRKEENEKIKSDLKKKGQIWPGIITCDGIVINGNRRKALLEELHAETGEERYKYLEVHVLPSNITKSELWLIEAGIQMSAPYQLEYSPINDLLKFKDGINSGLTVEEMAARIYGISAEKIKLDLKRLDLIDEYLKDFIGKPGKYYLTNGLAEHFIDLQNILTWAERPRGPIKRDWNPDENDINELKLACFYYIRGGFAHMRIRDLQKIFAKKDAWINACKAIQLNPNLNDSELIEAGLDQVPDTEELTDEDYYEPTSVETVKSAVEVKDLREEKVWKSVRQFKLKEFFEDAKEQEKIIEDSERPIALAKRALNNISAIPEDPTKLDDPEIDNILQQIITQTNLLRKITSKFRSRKKNIKSVN